jgi:hypothetical protein
MFSSLTHHSLSLYSPPIPKQVLLIDHQEAAVLESDRTHMTSLGSILTRNAEQEPDRVGIIDGDRSFSCSKQAREHGGLANRRQSELPASRQDPLRHCRRCEFQEICQKFCTQYFE